MVLSILDLNWWRGLAGWRRNVAALVLGAISVLAMPPFGLWPLMFLTFPGLVLLLDGAAGAPTLRARALTAAIAGWCFGFGYLVPGLYWIGGAFLVQADRFAILLPFAITLLPAYLALYFGFATGLASMAWKPQPARGAERVLALALALAASEWLRGHWFTGFPWNAIGYGLTIDNALAQSASLVGVTGLTFWAVLIFSAPVLLLGDAEWKRRWPLPLIALAVLVAGWVSGNARLSQTEASNPNPVQLRLVQPNTPETEKFEAASQRRIFDRILDLSQRDSSGRKDGLAAIKVLIWPEEPLNFLLLQSPEALAEIRGILNGHATLLTGTVRLELEPSSGTDTARKRYFNSLVAIDANGTPGAIFDKTHLVPFGEYLPYESWLGLLGLENLTRTAGGLAEGHNPRQLAPAGLPVLSPLICYEAIFPGEAVGPGDRPAWLLNITNDAWFGEQTGPYQHFHQARIRAIEEGLPLVRAAITGISAIVDAHGRVRQSLPLMTAGVIDGVLPSALPVTLYGRYGDILLFIHLLIGLALTTRLLQSPRR